MGAMEPRVGRRVWDGNNVDRGSEGARLAVAGYVETPVAATNGRRRRAGVARGWLQG
ncbi:hypothetical protein K439DRAFT_1642327 [Ramaria rubella]|nr:hypothetical protein K439DRAFT_1642538 [Ramaria rubella]KAF8574277.1 hypothetical protein K439DRAFT_1642327 [Ramaria rubella]